MKVYFVSVRCGRKYGWDEFYLIKSTCDSEESISKILTDNNIDFKWINSITSLDENEQIKYLMEKE